MLLFFLGGGDYARVSYFSKKNLLFLYKMFYLIKSIKFYDPVNTESPFMTMTWQTGFESGWFYFHHNCMLFIKR